MLWDPLSAWPVGRRWVWAGFALLVCWAQGPSFLRSLRPPETGGDFFQDWSSARNVLHGIPVYEDLRITTKRYLGGDTEPIFIRHNAHPPASVLLVLPFAVLDYSDATLAWNLASLVAFAVSLWLMMDGLGITPEWWWVFPLTALLLTCSPFRQQVNQGQFNLVLLLLITGCWIADRSGRPWMAGALLGVAVAVKLFPGLLFVYFLLRRRWSVLLGGLGGLVAITVATVAVLGPMAYQDYMHVIIPEVSQFRSGWANVSLIGFWEKMFGAGASHHNSWHVLPIVRNVRLARAGMSVSCLLVLVLWARAVWRVRTSEEEDGAFGLTLVVMLLVSPVAWDHYFLILLPFLLQFWMVPPISASGRLFRLALLACLWVNPVSLWQIFLPSEGFRSGAVRAPVFLLTVLSYQCYTLLVLFALGVVYLTGPWPVRLGRTKWRSLSLRS